MSERRDINMWKSVDWFTILIYVIMIVAGWFAICGASFEFESDNVFDLSGRPGTQLLWISLSAVIIFVIMMLDSSLYEIFSYLIYAIVIFLLIATAFLAPDIKGSHSWLVLGPIRLQPAEFAKFATALAVSNLMSSYGFKLTAPKNLFLTIMIIILPAICILLERETGSALVFLAFFLMLYREGMSGYFLLAGVCSVIFFVVTMKLSSVFVGITPVGPFIVGGLILFISTILILIERKDFRAVFYIFCTTVATFAISFIFSLFYSIDFTYIVFALIGVLVLYLIYLSFRNWVLHYAMIAVFAIASIAFMYSVNYVFDNILEPHQQERIKVTLGMENDPSGAGYNVNQSVIAIGSGGFHGKGFLNGTQTKLKYVPEQDTDFIFSTVGEEQGFVGSVAVILLFGALIIRLIVLAERQTTVFSRVYGYCVASIFFFHLIINIGMVTGMTPVIGIPLPFFSYGGSSLWGFTILLFIFLRLDASRHQR